MRMNKDKFMSLNRVVSEVSGRVSSNPQCENSTKPVVETRPKVETSKTGYNQVVNRAFRNIRPNSAS